MLNCGLGLVFFIAAAIALLWFREDVFRAAYELVGTDKL